VYGPQVNLEHNWLVPELSFSGDESRWYAIHTVARHEKRVDHQLREIGVVTFLPLMQQIRQWSDRRATVEVPLFSCYTFARMVQAAGERLRVLRTPGVLGFVGSERIGTPIPNEEIENLQMAIREKVPFAVHPFITVGKRVRIRGGSLDGVEGILARQGGDGSLVLSIDLLRRSVSIRVEGYDIELV
jgi:transcription termination/antitermination protein NusG